MLRLLGKHALNDRQVVRNIINPISGFRDLSLNLLQQVLHSFLFLILRALYQSVNLNFKEVIYREKYFRMLAHAQEASFSEKNMLF